MGDYDKKGRYSINCRLLILKKEGYKDVKTLKRSDNLSYKGKGGDLHH